jgi:hypothetical protein
MEKEPEKGQAELVVEAMKRLRNNQDFIDWREQVAKPLLTQWEQELLKSDTMDEVTLRANLKVRNTIKSLFYTWFENIQ